MDKITAHARWARFTAGAKKFRNGAIEEMSS
jgi:hypothetical protein